MDEKLWGLYKGEKCEEHSRKSSRVWGWTLWWINNNLTQHEEWGRHPRCGWRHSLSGGNSLTREMLPPNAIRLQSPENNITGLVNSSPLDSPSLIASSSAAVITGPRNIQPFPERTLVDSTPCARPGPARPRHACLFSITVQFMWCQSSRIYKLFCQFEETQNNKRSLIV